MKIALIDPSLFTWPYDVHLAKGLEENGHHVAIFGRSPGRRLEPDEIKYLRQHFYPGFETKLMRGLPEKFFLALKGLSHIESMLRLIWRLRKWQPDIIHFQWTPLAVIDKHFIPFFRRIAPVVLTVHDSAPFNNSPRAGLQRLDSISIMKRFDQLIVHTATARSRLAAHGVSLKKLNMVPHGLLMDLAPLAEAKAPDALVTLLLFGQIKPYKGVDVLLYAIAQLPPHIRQKCKVRIVGRPQMPTTSLFDMVESFGIKAQVEFDFRFVPEDEVRDMMLQADILVFPYREIDASGVLMLAIPAGKAIVASNVGLFGELLKDGRHGGLVKPDDPAALALALAPLIEDPQRRAAASQAVRNLANVIPGWTEIGHMAEYVYRRALSP